MATPVAIYNIVIISCTDVNVLDIIDTSRTMPLPKHLKKSSIWNHFNKVKQNELIYTECLICKEKIRYYGGTTNMSNHMKAKHPVTAVDNGAVVLTVKPKASSDLVKLLTN